MIFEQTIHRTEKLYNKLPFAVYCKSFRLLVDLLLIFKHRATSKVFRNGGLTVLGNCQGRWIFVEIFRVYICLSVLICYQLQRETLST